MQLLNLEDQLKNEILQLEKQKAKETLLSETLPHFTHICKALTAHFERSELITQSEIEMKQNRLKKLQESIKFEPEKAKPKK